jgi:hypothetical protein
MTAVDGDVNDIDAVAASARTRRREPKRILVFLVENAPETTAAMMGAASMSRP